MSTTEGQRWYREVYLQSDHWRGVRADAIIRACDRCERCGRHETEFGMEVHHLNYERLWEERPDDVEALCTICHRYVHDRASGWQLWQYHKRSRQRRLDATEEARAVEWAQSVEEEWA